MKRTLPRTWVSIALGLVALCSFSGCFENETTPRMAMFIGVDMSGSFTRSSSFDDGLDFTAEYIYAHLRGLGGLEIPKSLFVGSIGGGWSNDAKTFFPIETFQDKSVDQIRVTLNELFPKGRSNPLTDYNAFFKQVAAFVSNKNLLLKPISIVMISDGVPDVGRQNFRMIDIKGLEKLSRNVTLRLLYTDANTGVGWQTKVKRTRAKIWTQDASVMTRWREPTIFDTTKPREERTKFYEWIKDNVDFGVKAKRVD